MLIASTHTNRTFVKYLNSKNVLCIAMYFIYVDSSQSYFSQCTHLLNDAFIFIYIILTPLGTLGENLRRPILAMTYHSHKMLAVISHMFRQPVHSKSLCGAPAAMQPANLARNSACYLLGHHGRTGHNKY